MLCLWLPFTDGTTKNYGLTNMDVVDYGTSVYDQGKLGKCRSFVGNGYLQLSNAFGIESGKDFSCCYWIKEISNNILFQFRVAYQCGDLIIGYYGNKFNIYSATGNTLDLTCDCDTTEWVHCCVTYQSSNNTVTIYINGIKCSTQQPKNLTGLSDTTALIGKRSSETYLFEGYLNDFRIYNTCLSPRQVKEISRGLICHYPLGEIDGKIGGRNLIKNGKGNVKAGFFKNFPTVTDEYGEFTLKSKKTYKGIILDGFIYECRDYPVGEKYIWSYDIMYTAWNFPTGSNRGKLWMGQRYVNAPSGETATGAWRGVTQHNLPVVGQNGCELNKWYHVKQTVTIPQQASSNVGQQGIISFYNSNANVEASFTARLKNVKLEKSSTATPWTPAPEDDASFYDNVIYDTSGYNNNGSVTDSTCPTWSSDTPRYKGSYMFNGNNQFLKFQNPISSAFVEFSISCWVKFNNVTNETNDAICTMRSGVGTGVALFRIRNNFRFDDNAFTTFSEYVIPQNTWLHIVVTRSLSCKKLYINGILKQTTNTIGDMKLISNVGTIGASSQKGDNLSNYLNGQLSDFRIYATALDNQTIEELYKIGASLDSNGNLMLAGEVIEE